MANWCNTNYVVVGTEKEVKDFYQRLKKILNNSEALKSDFGNLWLGNILDNFGFNWKDINCRGFIDDFDFGVNKENQGLTVTFSTETAWVPMNEVFDKIFKEHYPSLRYYYSAEEIGCELYETNDVKGLYFQPFLLTLYGDESCWDEHEYYDNLEDALKATNKVLKKDFTSIEEVEDYLSNFKDVCGSLYEFQIINE